MTVTSTEVHLLNVARDEPEAAELWHAITERQLADWEGEWVPELFKAMQRLRRAGVQRQHPYQGCCGTERRIGVSRADRPSFAAAIEWLLRKYLRHDGSWRRS